MKIPRVIPPLPLPLLLLPLLLLSCGALWQTDTARAVEQALSGQYEEAAAVLEPAVAGGNTDPEVVESLYYSWVRQGLYTKARERFEAWSSANPNAGPIRLAAGRIQYSTGNYSRALTHFDSILNFADSGVAANFEKARLLESTGRREEAQAIYDQLIQNYLDGVTRDPGSLIYVARAMWAAEYFHDANDLFKLATQANPTRAETFVAWGDLLAEKYNEPESIASYQDALAIDPNLPEAHLGLAAAFALTDPESSTQSLERALEVNPNFVDAHLFVASRDIDSEQYDKAQESIGSALDVNPESAEALSLLAAIHFLRGNTGEFNRYVERVLQTNPQYNDLFYILADNCVSVRLYQDAVTFAREALRLNPRDFRSMSLLGINLLRIGDEEAGKQMLERAYEGDPFNVWTVNTLTLLDSFENFDRLQSPNFRIMLHKNESAPLGSYVSDLLEKAYTDLSAKYQFAPETPITFEMFPDHADFAVRTLGLPGLGALGVSFGKVVAMDSPSARRPDSFNWGSTLWHEFMHVVSLQMTDHKIPRWFSEGLSVYEERKAFPGWGDDLKLDFLQAIKNKTLLPTAELNNGFIRPKFPGQILVSYYQASLVCDYIESRYGFPAILEMLAQYKAGRTTSEVFQETLILDLDEFDRDFLEWVDSRVNSIDPEIFQELVSAGQEAAAKGDLDAAIEKLAEAVEMYPEYTDEHNPYEPLADSHLKKGNTQEAVDTLRKFLSFAETSFGAHLQLAELLEEAGDLAGASHALEGAVYIRPLDIELHRRLGSVLFAQREYAAAAQEYETLIALDAPDRAGIYYRLAEANFGEGRLQEARRNILRSLEIAPSYEPAQELLLEIVR